MPTDLQPLEEQVSLSDWNSPGSVSFRGCSSLSKKYRSIKKTPQHPVGATIGRPAILEQNCIAKCDYLFVFFENCNNCTAIVARAANRRPYGV